MRDDEEREIVERIRAERERALAADPDAGEGLLSAKQDFPIGIRPDGSVNAVTDGTGGPSGG
jgi:hypothetical protein